MRFTGIKPDLEKVEAYTEILGSYNSVAGFYHQVTGAYDFSSGIEKDKRRHFCGVVVYS